MDPTKLFKIHFRSLRQEGLYSVIFVKAKNEDMLNFPMSPNFLFGDCSLTKEDTVFSNFQQQIFIFKIYLIGSNVYIFENAKKLKF